MKSQIMRFTRLFALLIFGGFCFGSSARAAAPIAAYAPAATTVAILPVISKEDSIVEALKDRHITKALEELTTEFTRHGFKIADNAAVRQAISCTQVKEIMALKD